MDVAFALAVIAILAFAFTNGFHDAANAITTLVATRAPARAGHHPGRVLQHARPAAAGRGRGRHHRQHRRGDAGPDDPGGRGRLDRRRDLEHGDLVEGAALQLQPRAGRGLVGAAVVEAGVSAVNWGGVGGGHPEGVVGALVALAISPVLGFGGAWAMERGRRRALRRPSACTGRCSGPSG